METLPATDNTISLEELKQEIESLKMENQGLTNNLSLAHEGTWRMFLLQSITKIMETQDLTFKKIASLSQRSFEQTKLLAQKLGYEVDVS